ncbi:MAG TPA: HEAT repeat domain-containing protein [Thermoanaerobaculia bacterium]|nr:HEAT repeat domain-containing protein [Thermoanaerobaculia bacterium]
MSPADDPQHDSRFSILDPQSRGAQDVPRESARNILFQFVVFPLGVVVIGVGIFLLFGKLAGDERSIPDHLDAIRSGSSHQRWQAAYQLSKSIKRGEASRYPNLLEQIASIYAGAKDEDPRIRQYLSLVFGTLGDRRATPLLLEATSDPSVDTRVYALMGLAQLRDPAAVPRVVQLVSDEEKDVRKTAAWALGVIGDAHAVPALAAALGDPAADVRFNAAVALSGFGDRRALGVLREMLDRSRLDGIAGMRPDQKEEAIIVAIAPYARLAGDEARPDLEKLARDSSLRVQEAAREALATLR